MARQRPVDTAAKVENPLGVRQCASRWVRKSTNRLERLSEEIRRSTRVVRLFPTPSRAFPGSAAFQAASRRADTDASAGRGAGAAKPIASPMTTFLHQLPDIILELLLAAARRLTPQLVMREAGPGGRPRLAYARPSCTATVRGAGERRQKAIRTHLTAWPGAAWREPLCYRARATKRHSHLGRLATPGAR